jgi:uncharacterized protein (DUF1501 family)
MSAPLPFSRRELLKAGAALQALCCVPAAFRGALAAAGRASEGERVLLVVQLTGGNDGLNTVVPFADDRYHRARPVLAVAPGDVIRLDDRVGLHPALAPLRPLWEQGGLAVVQGVGPPQPDRSHFRSMEVWHTARTDETPPHAGWLGVATGSARAQGGIPAAVVGEREVPLALAGATVQAPALPSLEALRLDLPAGAARDAIEAACCEPAGRQALAAAVAGTYRDAFDCARRLDELSGRRGRGDFPPGGFGASLSLACQLVGARLGSRVLYATQGGYDTHAGQSRSHPALLRELAQGLAAFHAQLEAQGDGGRVVTLVFSEFGRRIEENASAGTDHGAGNPLLLLGRPVRGGVVGEPPDLSGERDADVPVTLDFRRGYVSLLDWLGLDAAAAVPGAFAPLPLLA